MVMSFPWGCSVVAVFQNNGLNLQPSANTVGSAENAEIPNYVDSGMQIP